MTLLSGIMVGALVVFQGELSLGPTTAVPGLGFLLVTLVTAASFWWTHVLDRDPGADFLYGQVLFDVVLVALVVHFTGIDESTLVPAYILVISEGALLLPLPGGVLVGILATILFFADIVAFRGDVTGAVALQIALFAVVAVATGILGDRLRRTGLRIGALESELEQLRLDTSDILDNLSTGVLTVDGEGRLAYLNPAGSAFLGLDREQWLGAPVMGRLEETAPRMGRVLRRAMEDHLPSMRLKTRVRRPDGTVLTLGVTTTILQRGEMTPPSATAIFQDITDLEALDLVNRRNERLEAMAEVSASLAHEIKNPLASIRSAVEQISSDGLDPDDRAVLQRLILGESDRLARLLTEFLEFSGMRMGRSQSLDFAELSATAIQLARQHPDAEGGVEVTCRGLEAPLHLSGDADLLHRAVFNLVLNAIQFSAPDGRVEVLLDRVGADERPFGITAEQRIRLRVRDSGPGVGPDEASRIFDPFYTTRRGGSGLGLAVVHRALEYHEGAVLVDRAPGGGAEFSLYLPTADDTGPAPGPPGAGATPADAGVRPRTAETSS
jgi:two-component system sensor histidine kinase PilS (NtrC family)